MKFTSLVLLVAGVEAIKLSDPINEPYTNGLDQSLKAYDEGRQNGLWTHGSVKQNQPPHWR